MQPLPLRLLSAPQRSGGCTDVSADFLRWAPLPPSIWSGGATAGGFKYDNVSIYSGSATVGPGGIPRMVYPGMCAGNCAHGHMTPPTDCYPLCKTGFTYGLVVPANLSDPLYSVWKKPDYNPIVSRHDTAGIRNLFPSNTPRRC